jgi:hypothetical protein
MKIQLIQGEFSSKETLELITKMIHVKINFHENKIDQTSSEEDTKRREVKIKQLQKELYEIRKHIEANGNRFSIQSDLSIS